MGYHLSVAVNSAGVARLGRQLDGGDALSIDVPNVHPWIELAPRLFEQCLRSAAGAAGAGSIRGTSTAVTAMTGESSPPKEDTIRPTPGPRAKTRARDLLGVAGLCIALAGCATHGAGPSASAAPSHDAAAKLTVDTPIGQICDDPSGRAALDRNLPNLRKNPNYFLFKGMSLRQVASMSGGKITNDKLESVQRDLAAISGGSAASAGVR